MAVVVRNACKGFESGVKVLDDLNLNLKAGSIYALLGASGCGKTTLISCLVGLKSLDSGSISLFGYPPGHSDIDIPGVGVGYMPQESSSLHPIFTIKETFWFFGTMYGMSAVNIEKRTNFLSHFLQLPDLSKMIINLSGGQLRRVSLAVAMIHQPPLLILDEPTVGLDPLVRQNIWKHLTKIVASEDSNTSILLTTHYNEEARFANTIGVMRRGRLIVEENPQTLLQLYESISLPKIILNLSKKDEEMHNNNNSNIQVTTTTCTPVIASNPNASPAQNQKSPPLHEKLRQKLRSYCTSKDTTILSSLIYKTVLLHRRHYLMIVAQLFLPLMNIIFYNAIVGTEPHGLKLGLVSDEWNELQDTSGVSQYCLHNEENTTCLGAGMNTICALFNQFDEGEVDWITKQSEDDALHSVQNGDSAGFLVLPANFTTHFQNRLLLRNQADNETLDGSIISARLDMSNAISTAWLVKRVLERYSTFAQDTVENCLHDPRVAQLPLKFNAIYGDLETSSWSLFIQPGLIIMLVYALSNIAAGVLITEKRLGVVDRWRVAGVRYWHVIASYLICESITIMGQIGTLFIVLPLFYGLRVQGSWLLSAVLVYLNGITGLSSALLMATVSKHELELMMYILLVNSYNIVACGALWPQEAVTPWYRYFCQLLPSSFPIDSLRSIVFRGWGLENFTVVRGIGISVFYTILAVILTLWFKSRQK